ncbi:hypothetical protein WA577_007143 [Blastocystis sp. JDR]
MFHALILKKSERLSVKRPILDSVRRLLPDPVQMDLQAMLESTDRLRETVMGTSSYTFASCISDYQRYFADAWTICQSFPVISGTKVPLSICWSEYELRNTVKSPNYAYECACTLFNIACLYTQKAKQMASETMDKQRVPEVEKDYLLASTIFHFIRTFLLPIYSTSPFSWDMSDRALHGFEAYCSALGHYCHIQNSAVDEPASYLAAAEKLFRDACSFFSQIPEASGLSLLCKYSASYCELKTLFIAAQRYDGVNSEEAIAYVRALTDLLLKKFDSLPNQIPASFSDLFRGTLHVNVNSLARINPRFLPSVPMFPIPPVKEELMMLCVPNCITLSASEFRQTVYAELIKELTREKQLLDQVAATAADRPEALLLACDTSCVPKEVAEQKGRLLQEGVAQAAQQKLQACEAKVSELNARIARMRSDVEAEKAHKSEDAAMRAVLGDVEGFDSGMFERRIAQDAEAAAEVTSELEAMKETADKLDKLGKLAANPAMEQRLCSNYPFARVAEARAALGQWRAVEEKRAALQSSIDAALACEQECFVLRSLLLEDHSPREISRVCGMQLNRVKERLPAIHTLYRDLYECFNGFERAYLPLVEVIQADAFVSKNSVFIQRLMEFPEMEAKVNEAYEEILPSVAMAEESVAKNEASLNKALLYRRRQREEYERKLKTIRICPCCNAMNDAKARNCNTCGGLLRSL